MRNTKRLFQKINQSNAIIRELLDTQNLKRGPLQGCKVVVKDNISTQGIRQEFIIRD